MRVLLIDDEENLLIVLADQLASENCEVFTESDAATALTKVSEIIPDVVVTDLKMQNLDGIGVTKYIKQHAPDIPVIVLTAYGEVTTAVEAIKAGAVDYLTKPVDPDSFMITLRRAVNESSRAKENIFLRDEVQTRLGFSEFIGDSDEALDVRQFIARTAETTAPVLLMGESGTGKELVARLIHSSSSRSKRPFLTVNCREPSINFMLKDLFGRSNKDSVITKGKLEIANGGSILLDEVAALPIAIQDQLQQTIESGIIEKGGSTRVAHIDIRFFATSTNDLQEEVSLGHMTTKLFHRLNVLSLTLPRLAERRTDIPVLAKFFIHRNMNNLNIKDSELTDLALKALCQYEWPGNVRELANVIERAMVMSIDGKIKLSDLPTELVEMTKTGQDSTSFIGLREKLLAEERRLIMKALEKNSYIQHRAAKSLGVSRSLLNQKIKRLNIDIPGKATEAKPKI